MRFLTIVPVPGEAGPPSATTLVAFPFVGLLVGLAWAAPIVVLERFPVPTAVIAVGILIIDAVLTGGLHLDAAADVADGVASRRQGDEAVAVMRDPSVGALGAAALVLAILLRYSLLLFVVGLPGWSGVIAIPVIGRTSMVLLLALVPSRGDGSLADVSRKGAGKAAGLAVLATGGIAWYLAGTSGLGVVGVAVLGTACYGWWWWRTFGGLTGDGAGAGGFASETLALCALTTSLI